MLEMFCLIEVHDIQEILYEMDINDTFRYNLSLLYTVYIQCFLRKDEVWF